MKSPAVNSDITRFIDTRLKCRQRLQKWLKSQELTKSELLQRADGVGAKYSVLKMYLLTLLQFPMC